jgi:deoxycytidylate deaminase
MINNKFITIFPRLIQEASKSQIKCQLAAALIKGQKLLSKPCSNALRNVCRGFACGSLHAEAHAILDYFGRDLSYSSKNGGSFYIPKDKKVKCDLIVIRINKDEKICTSRPCYNCLNMMKAVGIRKVYYTDNDEKIICENVKDMISINASSVTRLIHRLRTDKNQSDIDFFENLKFDAQSLKQYRIDAARLCAETLGDKPALCLSGGIDSQAMVQSWHEAGLEFDTIID